MQKLTKGDDSWSLAEVVQAIVLLAHFHSLSSFVFSCGINEEVDSVAGHYYIPNVRDISNNMQAAKDKKLSSSPKKIPNGDGKTGNVSISNVFKMRMSTHMYILCTCIFVYVEHTMFLCSL